MMTRSGSFLAVMMFSAFATGLLATASPAQASGNCQAKLVGNAYDCTYNDSTPILACIEFSTGGISKAFDLSFDPGGTYGCECQATGSVKAPSFQSSASAFECVSSFSKDALSGKIKGKKMSAQGSNLNGQFQFVLGCTKRSSPCP